MDCRHYRSKDYAEIIDLFYTTVHTINAADYSAEELEAWAPSDKSDFFQKKSWRRVIVSLLKKVEKF